MSRRQLTAAPAVLVTTILLLLATACGGTGAPAGGGGEESAERAPIRAATAPAERLEVPEQREVFGSVRAEKTADVSARVMAMVTAVHVEAGDRVDEGELLLEIDPQAAKGQLAQARGALAQARAALTLAERNYRRFQALGERDAASELEVDVARMQYEQATGAVEQAEGAVEAAAAVADDSHVAAPFAGRVVSTMVERGDLAAPGRPLVTLESEGGHRLALSVPESLMLSSGLELGDPLRLSIDTRPDLGTFEGTVAEISAGADPLSHSFAVEVTLPAAGLASGLSGRAWIPGSPRTVIRVPAAAVVRQGGLDMLVLRSAAGRTTSRVVTLGREMDGSVEVLSGLTGGEEVLLGLAAVPPTGTRVEPAR